MTFDMTPNIEQNIAKVLDIVRLAGGEIVGRTRFQKTVCILELADVGYGFHFDYYHYGPYSDDLSDAITMSLSWRKLNEEIKRADWGSPYSIFRVVEQIDTPENADEPSLRHELIKKAVSSHSIVLELAVTAAYLAKTGVSSPWKETQLRKFDKAQDGRLAAAKQLYKEFRLIAKNLPEIKS